MIVVGTTVVSGVVAIDVVDDSSVGSFVVDELSPVGGGWEGDEDGGAVVDEGG